MINYRNTILVVDDIEINRAILCETVQDEYEVMEAQNGYEALQLIYQHRDSIALILLDIMMPQKNGYEVLAEMRELNLINVIPVIVVTVLDKLEGESKALELGAIDVLIKPFEPILLKRRIQNVISAHQYNRMYEAAKNEMYAEIGWVNQEVLELSDRLKEFKKENEQLKQLVKLDHLTGVYNRNAIQEFVKESLKEEPYNVYGFLLIEFGNMDELAQKYGQYKEECMLQNFSQIIKAHLKRDDIVGRLEDHCFIVFMKEYRGSSYAEQKAANIISAIKGAEAELDAEDCIQVGIGAAAYPQNGRSYEELYVAAKKLLDDGKWGKTEKHGIHSFFMMENDTLVDVMNSNDFFEDTKKIMQSQTEEYSFIRIDIDNFMDYTEKSGYLEGEKLLAFLVDEISIFVSDRGIFGKIYTAAFGIYAKISDEEVNGFVNGLEIKIFQCSQSMELTPYCGIYKNQDIAASPVELWNNAGLACQKAKKTGSLRVIEYYRS